MSGDGLIESRSGFWTSVLSLFTSSSTLVCCAIPALLVALGAGATLSSLVAVFPQVVWLSEQKEGVFALAGLMTLAGGAMQWRSRSAPCPVDPALRDPALRDACLRTRKTSALVFGVSVLLYLVGGWFAFVQPFFGG